MKAKLETCEAEIERSKKNELNFLPLSSFNAEPYVLATFAAFNYCIVSFFSPGSPTCGVVFP